MSIFDVNMVNEVTDVSKMHSNEAILIFLTTYSLPRAYAVFCGRFIITLNLAQKQG